jgi:glycosyltransferase involved in cell wall biosynthesis
MTLDEAKLPVVSIVTPSFNQARFIRDTLESVRAQEYPRLEHIVIDGGSRDGTQEILARYPTLRWVSEADTGQTGAINRGFRASSGEIVSWLNSDDVLLPGAVTAVVEAFLADPAAMLVYGDGDLIDADGRHLEPFRFTEAFTLRRLIEVHDYILQPAAFVRRPALEAVGFLDEGLSWCMDWDLWIRIGRRFPVRYLPRRLAQARVHPDSKTSRAGWPKLGEMRRVVRRHSGRRLPPVLVIHGGGTLYRMVCRMLGSPGRPRRDAKWSPVAWAYRRMNRIVETGRLPWELGDDPALRRPPDPTGPSPSGVAPGAQ